MINVESYKPGQIYMGRLEYNSDLYEEITDFCQNNEIKIGRIEALGAVTRARLSFYNQCARYYQKFEIIRPLEILKLVGNVSIKDEKPFIHAHVTLADETGETYGGHLETGTKVFACEIVIVSFSGIPLVRDYDKQTGLSLWKMTDLNPTG